MNMPGMAGEAAVYKTNNCYRATAGGSLANNGNMAVIPQDCGFWTAIQCGIYVGATVAACGVVCAACAATAVACPVCAACVLVGGVDAYIACRDCLPGSITRWVDSALMGDGRDGGGTPPPDCTTTGCRAGLVCCDCISPARCTSPARCHQLCQL
jgi:hypothetical protein